MPSTFTWFPDASHDRQLEPRVSSARFGDGYEQRVANGINNQLQTWSLTFTRGRTEADQIDAFLKARGAVESFTWITPDEETLLFICRKWSKKRERGVKCTINCEFEQVAA